MADLPASARGIAALEEYLLREHGKRVGFAVFVFDFGDTGDLAYISNSSRDDMIKAVEEWLVHARADNKEKDNGKST